MKTDSLPRWRGLVVPYVTGHIDFMTREFVPLDPSTITKIEQLSGDPGTVEWCSRMSLCEVCGEPASPTLELVEEFRWVNYETSLGLDPLDLESTLSGAPLHPECARIALVQCPALRANRAKIRFAPEPVQV